MFKSYATKKDTPNRRARKNLRNSVFQFNRKIAKTQRKAARLARRENEANNQ